MSDLSALVKPIRAAEIDGLEKRRSERQACCVEGVTRTTEAVSGLGWGAIVKDISGTGLGLTLCYPFRPGTYLVVDLAESGEPRSLLARVVHVRDERDGTWHVGCELVKKLGAGDAASRGA
jgi:hypothetical protein